MARRELSHGSDCWTTDVPFISSPRRHDARNNWTRSDHKFLGSPLNYTTLHLVKTAAYIGVRHANNSRLSRTFRTISRHTRSVHSHEVSLGFDERILSREQLHAYFIFIFLGVLFSLVLEEFESVFRMIYIDDRNVVCSWRSSSRSVEVNNDKIIITCFCNKGL